MLELRALEDGAVPSAGSSAGGEGVKKSGTAPTSQGVLAAPAGTPVYAPQTSP